MTDNAQAFLLNQGEYRGVIVHLEQVYQMISQQHAYPAEIQLLLGEMLVAVSLLGQMLKNPGRLSLQIETPGYLQFLVSEINHRYGIRGLGKCRNEALKPANLLSEGRCAMTWIPDQGERYQGVVTLQGDSIAQSLENYFHTSEQVFSKILLTVSDTHAAGIFIQQLPLNTDQQALELDHVTLQALLSTVTPQELLQDSNEHLLRKLFHEYSVELFPEKQIHFECTCTVEKMKNTVKLLGQEEINSILSTHPTVEVTCDFCSDHYHFDRVALAEVLATRH